VTSSPVRRKFRSLLADPERPGSMANRARTARWQRLLDTFPDLADMSVLDLGGTTWYWSTAPVRPASLTLLNPPGWAPDVLPWAEVVPGDACGPPPEIRARRFDLVYSNSTLEHVGGHYRRQQFAEVTRTQAPQAWVQTPYRYFPVEPHFLIPGFQQLPLSIRVRLATVWPLTPSTFPTDRIAIRDELMEVELLSVTEMRSYFPDAQIMYERAAGLIKSIIAVRGATIS
jgi:hypothetical protein